MYRNYSTVLTQLDHVNSPHTGIWFWYKQTISIARMNRNYGTDFAQLDNVNSLHVLKLRYSSNTTTQSKYPVCIVLWFIHGTYRPFCQVAQTDCVNDPYGNYGAVVAKIDNVNR